MRRRKQQCVHDILFCRVHFFISFYGFFFLLNSREIMIEWEWLTCIKQKFKQCFLARLCIGFFSPPPTAGGRGASIVKENNILWRRLIAMDKNRQNWKKILCNIRRQTSIKDFPNFGWIETGKNLIWKCGAHFLEYRRSLFKGKP